MGEWLIADREEGDMKDENTHANIVRVRKDARYFVASNVPFNDERLSWEARGVMGYLLSKPDDWKVWMGDLVNKGPSSIRIIKRVMAELRNAGYMSRKKIRRPDGTFTWITTIYESPELNSATIDTKTIDGSTIDGECIDVLSTDLELKEERGKSTKENMEGEIYRMYENNIGAITEISAQIIGEMIDTYPADWIKAAFTEAVKNNARKLSYIKQTLSNWKANGYGWKPDQGKKPAYKQPEQPKRPKARML